MAEFEIETDDLSADAVLKKLAAEHDGVAEKLEEYNSLRETADAAEAIAEALDAEVDDLEETVESLTTELDELRAFKDEAEADAKREHAEAIAEVTDKFGEVEDLMELELDELEERHELVDELSATTKSVDASEGGTDKPRPRGRYAVKPEAWG